MTAIQVDGPVSHLFSAKHRPDEGNRSYEFFINNQPICVPSPRNAGPRVFHNVDAVAFKQLAKDSFELIVKSDSTTKKWKIEKLLPAQRTNSPDVSYIVTQSKKTLAKL